jgi:hypothetical protein
MPSNTATTSEPSWSRLIRRSESQNCESTGLNSTKSSVPCRTSVGSSDKPK